MKVIIHWKDGQHHSEFAQIVWQNSKDFTKQTDGWIRMNTIDGEAEHIINVNSIQRITLVLE